MTGELHAGKPNLTTFVPVKSSRAVVAPFVGMRRLAMPE